MKPFAISELSEMSGQGQRKLTRTDSIHINCKRVCKIVQHSENARFSYVLALEKKNVVAENSLPLYPLLRISYFE